MNNKPIKDWTQKDIEEQEQRDRNVVQAQTQVQQQHTPSSPFWYMRDGHKEYIDVLRDSDTPRSLVCIRLSDKQQIVLHISLINPT